MKTREGLTALALAVTTVSVAGCESSSPNSTPAPISSHDTKPTSTVTQVKSGLRFVAEGSPFYQAVNCELNPNDKAGTSLTNPTSGPEQIGDALTLGVTEHGTNAQRVADTNKFLGGVSIISLGGFEYQVASYDDSPGSAVDIKLAPGDPIARRATYIGKDGRSYHIETDLNLVTTDPANVYAAASISCLPPTGPETNPTVSASTTV